MDGRPVTFGAPQLLWLGLLAPVAAGIALWAWRRRLRATAAWASRELWPRLRLRPRRRRLIASVALLALATLGAAGALSRPRWGEIQERVDRRGVDVVFVLDSSLSMAAEDVSPSRFWVAKALIRQMLGELPGHRLALVQGEGEGAVLAPLTLDAAVIDLLLDTVLPGSLAMPGTRLAPWLEEAQTLFPAAEGQRVIVLLSDGEDHGGGVQALVERLSRQAVTVHAVGVGTPSGTSIPLPGGDESKRDEQGRVVVSRLHEEVLEGLARATGGVYLRVASPAARTRAITTAIARLEARSVEGTILETLAERFQWPLAVGAAALLLQLLISPFAPEPPEAPARPHRRHPEVGR